jgi:hypothetical protein
MSAAMPMPACGTATQKTFAAQVHAACKVGKGDCRHGWLCWLGQGECAGRMKMPCNCCK